MASSPKIDDLKKKFDENPRRYFAPLANEYRKAGQVDQAIAICREYLPQQPGHMSGHIVFGQALFEAKQMDEAKTVFETALSLDPENLIALKHLGDITLLAGDKEAAKGWYKRVLDADPRNEEAHAQMKRLDQPAGAAPTPVASLSTQPTQPVPTAKVMAAATSAPTVVMAAVKKPTAPAPAAPAPAPAAPAVPTAASPTAEISLEGLTHGAGVAPKAGPAAPPVAATVIIEAVKATEVPPVAPAPGLETTAIASAADAPPLDSFSLEGLESTSMAAPPPPPPPAPAAAIPAIDLDFAPPAAPTPVAAVPAPAPPPPAPVADEPGLVDLHVELPAPVAPPPAMEAPAAPADLPMIDVDIPAAAPAPEPAMAESTPFVTETMAELYLQQGHTDEALRVYRALLQQRPGDAALEARIASLEAPPPVAPMASAPPAVPSMPHVEGPSIRSILLLIAERRPGHRPAGAQNGGAPDVAAESAGPAAAPAAAAAPTAGGPPSRLASDTLSALWGQAAPDPREETAAIMLAMAFADLDGMERAAAGAATAGGVVSPPSPGTVAPPSSFSFDKFFSQRVTAEHATQAPGAAAPTESQEDVAKFTRWLEGLKQQ